MTVTRRTLIKSGAAVLAASTVGTSLARRDQVAVIIYDGRSPRSSAFAAMHAGQLIDVANEDSQMWQSLRKLPMTGKVAGFTRWNDFVLARGFLLDRGLRMSSKQVENGWWRWSMVSP